MEIITKKEGDIVGSLKTIILSVIYAIEKKVNVLLSRIDVAMRIQPNIRDTSETIDILQDGRISMSRLGDGEFMLIFGHSIRYQCYDPELKARLIEILHSNIPNHIVCISDVFGDMKERNTENKIYWTNHLRELRHKYYKYIDMKKIYYNTSATRVYKLLEDKALAAPRFDEWKSLWNEKDVVFIEGAETRMGVGNNLFSNAKSIRRIICPAENAFEKFSEILKQVLKLEHDALIILALGPTATVLSYELARQGYYALDLGHIDIEYEWFLRDNSEIAISGKYTNEVVGGNVVTSCDDEEYKSQIICSIL